MKEERRGGRGEEGNDGRKRDGVREGARGGGGRGGLGKGEGGRRTRKSSYNK